MKMLELKAASCFSLRAARGATCLAAVGKNRVPPLPSSKREIDQLSAVVYTRKLPSWQARNYRPWSLPFYHTCTGKSDAKDGQFLGRVRWACKKFSWAPTLIVNSEFIWTRSLGNPPKLRLPLLGARLPTFTVIWEENHNSWVKREFAKFLNILIYSRWTPLIG